MSALKDILLKQQKDLSELTKQSEADQSNRCIRSGIVGNGKEHAE
jgi:hypothetical protein